MAKKTKLTKGTKQHNSIIKNDTVQSNNVLGIRNVQQTPSGKFQAHITMLGKQFNLTTFDTPEEASASLKGAEKIYKVLQEKGLVK